MHTRAHLQIADQQPQLPITFLFVQDATKLLIGRLAELEGDNFPAFKPGSRHFTLLDPVQYSYLLPGSDAAPL